MPNFNTPPVPDTTETWITPRDLLAKLGHFDLDPCAALHQPWPTADRMMTVRDNGLLLPWEGRVWCNPPYGRSAQAFMERMATHTGGGLALVFARTDTRWFQDSILSTARAMFLWRGRIRFCREDGTQGAAPNAASCLVAWDVSELDTFATLEKQGHGKMVIL